MAPQNQFDHIAIGASNLDVGADHIKTLLGVDIPMGGEHTLMGTHNRLMSLGHDLGTDTYMEVIAINPNADRPSRPLWFGLDSDEQQEFLSESPKPVAWVMRTNNIERTLVQARDAGIDLGEPLEMTRGALCWIIAVREDGLLPEGGTLPVVIQWPDGPHPANSMKDFGFRINAIRLSHPQPQELTKKLEAIDADHLVTVEPFPSNKPSVSCDLLTPNGKLVRL